MDAWISQLRKGLAQYVILLVLRDREAYGYEILKQLSTVDTLELGESTLYPLLNRLTQDGLLAVRRVGSPAGPPRRYYRLTASGKALLEEMDGYWTRFMSSICTIREEGSHEDRR